MKIKIDDIKLLPSRRVYPKVTRSWFRKAKDPHIPIVLIQNGEKYLLQGTRQIQLALNNDEKKVDCVVMDKVTQFEGDSMRVADEYFSSLLPPCAMGESFKEYREKYILSLRDVENITGIPPTSIHHYESLTVKLAPRLIDFLDNGKLRFKEARSLADIENHERQYEIAIPFIEGKISSSKIEEVVAYAKKHPRKSIDQIIDKLNIELQTSNIKATVEFPSDTSEYTLKFAAHIEGLANETIPEYKKARIISSLKIAKNRIETALKILSKR